MNDRPDTFRRRERPCVEGLEPWLDKATNGLCTEAVERVCHEVLEHCMTSLELKMAYGMSRAEADPAVMAELGSWRAARRRFRRTHLTKGDILRLAWFTGRPEEGALQPRACGVMWAGIVLWLLLLLPAAIKTTSLSFAINQWSMAIFWISLGTRMTIGPLIRWWRPEFNVKRLVALSALMGSTFVAANAVLGCVSFFAIAGREIELWSDTFQYLTAPFAYAVLMLLPVFLDVRLARKLPRASKPVAP